MVLHQNIDRANFFDVGKPEGQVDLLEGQDCDIDCEASLQRHRGSGRVGFNVIFGSDLSHTSGMLHIARTSDCSPVCELDLLTSMSSTCAFPTS